MTTKLTSIRYKAPGLYEVELQATSGASRVFIFEVKAVKVETGEIDLVQSPDGYSAYIEYKGITAVEAAVQAFHQARKLEFP